jgi:hypothetical protein
MATDPRNTSNMPEPIRVAATWEVMEHGPDYAEPFGFWLGPIDTKPGQRIMLRWLNGSPAYEVEVVRTDPEAFRLVARLPEVPTREVVVLTPIRERSGMFDELVGFEVHRGSIRGDRLGCVTGAAHLACLAVAVGMDIPPIVPGRLADVTDRLPWRTDKPIVADASILKACLQP